MAMAELEGGGQSPMQAKAEGEALALVDEAAKRALMARLARVAGQVEGVRRMIERGESCEKVAQQLAAARAALNRAFAELMARVLERNCLNARELDPEARRRLEAIVRILSKYA